MSLLPTLDRLEVHAPKTVVGGETTTAATERERNGEDEDEEDDDDDDDDDDIEREGEENKRGEIVDWDVAFASCLWFSCWNLGQWCVVVRSWWVVESETDVVGRDRPGDRVCNRDRRETTGHASNNLGSGDVWCAALWPTSLRR